MTRALWPRGRIIGSVREFRHRERSLLSLAVDSLPFTMHFATTILAMLAMNQRPPSKDGFQGMCTVIMGSDETGYRRLSMLLRPHCGCLLSKDCLQLVPCLKFTSSLIV